MWDQFVVHPLEHVIENLPAGVVVIADGGFFVNRAVEQITGFTRHELVSIDRWFELVYRDQAAWYRERYEARKGARNTGARLVPLIRKNDEVRQVEITAYFDDTVEYWHLSDVTDQMAVQRRFEFVFSRSRDGLGILEPGPRGPVFTQINPAALRIFGEPDETRVIGTALVDTVPSQLDGRDAPSIVAELVNAVERGEASPEVEYEIPRAGQPPRPVHLKLHPLQEHGQDLLLGTWRDLTESRRARAQALHNSKMVSLGEMSSGLAHELNTPLAVIKGKAQQLRQRLNRGELDRDQISSNLDVVDKTVDRMSSIVTGLRSFARDSGQDPFTTEAVAVIVRDVLALCEARMNQHGVSVRTTVDPSLRVRCRPSQIAQVLLNLVANAFDAVTGRDERWVEISAEPRGDRVLVRVRDSGPGVPVALRSRVMQPFFTTKPVGQGTGLGLSISSGILAAHGGELVIDDANDRSCFTFTLGAA